MCESGMGACVYVNRWVDKKRLFIDLVCHENWVITKFKPLTVDFFISKAHCTTLTVKRVYNNTYLFLKNDTGCSKLRVLIHNFL